MSGKKQKKTKKPPQKRMREKKQNKLRELMGRRIEPEALTFGRIFIAQAVLFFAICAIMLALRFSTDSYSVFFNLPGGRLNAYLNAGRTGAYLLYRALMALGLDAIGLSPVFTAVFLLTVSWSAAALLWMLKPCFPSPDRLTVLLLELGVLLAYANIYVAELYFFSDIALIYAFAAFFQTLAVRLFFLRNWPAGTILATVCLFLSLSFYQAFLGFFIIFGSTLLLLRHDIPGVRGGERDLHRFALDLLRLAAVGAASSLANMLVISRLTAAGYNTSRGPASRLAEIAGIIGQVGAQFRYYYPMGYPGYLTGLVKFIFVLAGPVLLCLLAVSFFKDDGRAHPFAPAAITLAVLFCGLMSVFAPHFLSQSVWVTPRSICSFFAVFTAAAVVIGCNYARDEKAMPWAAAAVMLLLLAVNVVGIWGIALDQLEVNRLDRAEAEEIVRRIESYEEESGQTVTTISWMRDSRYTQTHRGIKYTFMDMNVRAGARSWSLVDCIGYYAGRRFQSKTMPDKIRERYFSGMEWSSFRPEEQIVFEGDRMYLMVY